MEDFKRILIRPDATIKDAIKTIDLGAAGIALVVDDKGKLVATITDGDIRRAILGGVSLDSLATETLKFHSEQYNKPTVASERTEQVELFSQIINKSIRHLPIVDEENRVVDLILLSDLLLSPLPQLSAVVMAGGYGSRLQPLTEDVPKPMLKVGGRPLMEQMMEQLRDAGIRHVRVATHYKHKEIEEYFGDGSDLNMQLDYLKEDKPLGTAGALGLMETPEDPMLVINGDILTDMSFQAMHDFHLDHKADMTVGIRKYDFQVPFGVVETKGVNVSRLEEKPQYDFFVNAGIYLLEPVAWKYIPRGQRFDMTDLINLMLADNRSVISFPIREYWIDIGELADYKKAQDDIKDGRI